MFGNNLLYIYVIFFDKNVLNVHVSLLHHANTHLYSIKCLDFTKIKLIRYFSQITMDYVNKIKHLILSYLILNP